MNREDYILKLGDCLELMKELPDNSIDAVITSPPYDNLRTYGDTLNWNKTIWQLVIKSLFRVLKNGGVVVWNVADATIDGSETLTSFKQALYFKKIGFNLHDTMIWNKKAFNQPHYNRYGNCFEYMFIFSKDKPTNVTLLKDRKNKHFGGKIHGRIREADGYWHYTSSHGKAVSEYGRRFNIWEIPPCNSNLERTGHPAQMPVQLAEDHLLTWTNPNDLILDPFAGSGTTGIACIIQDRKFIGYELNPDYWEIASKRIEEAFYNKQFKLF